LSENKEIHQMSKEDDSRSLLVEKYAEGGDKKFLFEK